MSVSSVESTAGQARAKLGSTKSELARKKHGRSRVSNGTEILPGITDGRSLIVRRFRDIQNAIVSDQGGADQLTEARLQLVRRFAAAAVLAEQIEAKLANDEQINISEHALLCSSLVRLANRIGLGRMARDVTPTLGDLIRADQEEQRRRLAQERAQVTP